MQDSVVKGDFSFIALYGINCLEKAEKLWSLVEIKPTQPGSASDISYHHHAIPNIIECFRKPKYYSLEDVYRDQEQREVKAITLIFSHPLC